MWEFISIFLFILNVFLMILFFVRIKKRFSHDKIESLMRDRMTSILRDFNFQTSQAVTILEEKIEEMRDLISDADKRFVALSSKMEMTEREMEYIKKIDASTSIPTANLNASHSFVVTKDSSYNTLDVSSQNANYHVFREPAQNDKIVKMKVVEMYKNGWSIDFIADKLSIPQEEVRLITFMASRDE